MAKAVVCRAAQPCAGCGQTIFRNSFAAYPPGQDRGLHHLDCVPAYPGLGAKFVSQYNNRCSICHRPYKPGDVIAFLADPPRRAVCGVCMVTPPDAPEPARPAPAGPRKPDGPPAALSPPQGLTAAPVAASTAADIHAHLDRSQLAGGVLLDHQLAGSAWLLDHRRALLADEVGLGKTITAFGVISALHQAGEITSERPVMWVTEASLVRQAEAELTKFLPTLSVVTGMDKAFRPNASAKAQREMAGRLATGVHVYVLSYDFLHTKPSLVAGLLRSGRSPLLVLDEATAIKQGPTGVTWQAVKDLSEKADRVIGMTATPLENDPTETWAILTAIGTPNLWDQSTFESKFVRFKPGYQPPRGPYIEPRPVGFKGGMLAPFRAYLDTVTLRRTAVQAGVQKPAFVGAKYRWVPLTDLQKRDYQRVRNLPGLYGHQQRERLARSANGGSSAILNACMAELKSRPATQKTVIYTETIALGDRLCEALEAAQIGYVRVQGDTGKDQRQALIERHRDDPDVRVFVGSRVLEYGLNLQHANVMLSLDPSWNPAREQQREGRICRIGSPHLTYEHLTFVPDTQQARQKAAELSRKGQMAADVLDPLAGESA